jgi:hypothetical protein
MLPGRNIARQMLFIVNPWRALFRSEINYMQGPVLPRSIAFNPRQTRVHVAGRPALLVQTAKLAQHAIPTKFVVERLASLLLSAPVSKQKVGSFSSQK